jgi:hypothetical protein
MLVVSGRQFGDGRWRTARGHKVGSAGDRPVEQQELQIQAKALAPHSQALLTTPQGRRRATQLITTNYEHIPADQLAHQMLGIAGCTGATGLIQSDYISTARRGE